MRYIDADALLNNLPDDLPYKASVKRVLIQAPTEDVVEVREGRWKGAGMGDYYCSLCCNTYSGGDEFNYCPNCGAKMDGERREE